MYRKSSLESNKPNSESIKARRNEYNQKYYREHLEEIKNKQKQYRLTEEHKERAIERTKEWRLSNPERAKQNHNNWVKNNIEKERKRHRESARKAYSLHPEKGRAASKKWRTNHPDVALKQNTKWREKNPDKVKEINKKASKKWRVNNLDNVRARKRKSQAKRVRELGFKPLNDFFNNSDAHHLDKINVIYIPQELHKACPHEQNQNEKMKQINLIAWNYLEASVL